MSTLWKFRAGKSIGTRPCVNDGIVYAGSNDNKLYAVDTERGQQKWEFEKEVGWFHQNPRITNWSKLLLILSLLIYSMIKQKPVEFWERHIAEPKRAE